MAAKTRILSLSLGTQTIGLAEFKTGQNGGLVLSAYETRELLADPAADATSLAQTKLVLDEIARRENLTVAPEDVDKEIAQFAERSGRTPAALRAQLEKEGGLARLTSGLRREKAVDFAMSHAKMTTD